MLIIAAARELGPTDIGRWHALKSALTLTVVVTLLVIKAIDGFDRSGYAVRCIYLYAIAYSLAPYHIWLAVSSRTTVLLGNFTVA